MSQSGTKVLAVASSGPGEVRNRSRRGNARMLAAPTAEVLVLTPDQARRYLGISDRSLYRMLKDGTIRAERLRGQWFIPKRPFFERFGQPPELADSISEKRPWPDGSGGSILSPELEMNAKNTDRASEIQEAATESAPEAASKPALITPNAVARIYGVKARLVRGLADDYHKDPKTGIRNIRRNGRTLLFWKSVEALFGSPRPEKPAGDAH